MKPIFTSHPLEPTLAARLRAMPKVEIHVHLEGAADAATVWEMARRNNLPLPAQTLADWEAFYEFQDFAHFVQVWYLATRSLRTAEDYAWLVERFVHQQAAQNIRYSEAFFSPQLHFDRDLTPTQLLDALEQGAQAGEAATGSRVRFLVDLDRSRGADDSAEAALQFALAGRARNGLFLGLSIGGPEVGYPPELFTDLFARARTAGLRIVAHAGETTGPASVWGALRSLHAERIGHGISALDDPTLLAELHHTQTPLDVSPTSNYCLKVVPTDQPHPIRQLLEARVLVTLNSDDPPMFSTDLVNEYYTLAQQGFTWPELWQLNLNTLEASFLPAEEKALLRRQWQQFSQSIEE
ncbi:adenosine deaminase [Hymenobacter volaticus]|uniref:Adenosine deaminase n=1 Tax=Hymenobacter volaticus TaxID=2932254 RepID=A0ABY4GG64_9BACT|nr:adenosine deaminase [Hymenobacter volaticus]UOQ69857.1 adenosine deaminase [Hymenobacter volaticus]